MDEKNEGNEINYSQFVVDTIRVDVAITETRTWFGKNESISMNFD